MCSQQAGRCELGFLKRIATEYSNPAHASLEITKGHVDHVPDRGRGLTIGQIQRGAWGSLERAIPDAGPYP
jgi:hypothetical protein